MNFINQAVIALAGCILLFACKKGDKATPSLTVDKTVINTTATEGKEYIQVTSNTSWKLTGLPNWLSVTPDNGKTDARVELSFIANEGLDQRTATITISGEEVVSSTIKITQMGATPTILADKLVLAEKGQGQEDSITITSNIAWKIETPSDATWLTADKTTGTPGTTKVKFLTAANSTHLERKATLSIISIGADVNPVSIKITQEQGPVLITSFTEHAAGLDTITIAGTGFSPNKSENTVTINGKPATVTESSPTSIKAIVPVKAGTGKVAVRVGNKLYSTQEEFNYDLSWHVSTWAGDGTTNILHEPMDIALDSYGNGYVADHLHRQIKRIIPLSNGTTMVEVYAGTGELGNIDGLGTNCTFQYPQSIFIDKNNTIYISQNDAPIRKISSTGIVSTVLDNTGVALNIPSFGITSDELGNIYAANTNIDGIQKISPSGVFKRIEDASGNGISIYTTGIKFRQSNKSLYAVDNLRNRILQMRLNEDGTFQNTIVAGSQSGNADGSGSTARFSNPYGIAVDGNGNLYVSDMGNRTIRKITPQPDGTVIVSTIAGDGRSGTADGKAMRSSFKLLSGIAVNAQGTEIYVADQAANTIRKIAFE